MNSITKAATSGSSSAPNSDIKSLLDGWIEAERNGVQFPVPFDLAWRIAGYSKKANGKRELTGIEPSMWCSKKSNVPSNNATGVTRIEDITLSLDGFKDFCLLAKTPEGRQVRQYFIESEKKWRLVQQIAPQVAQDVELMRIQAQESLVARQIQLAQAEQQKAQAEMELLDRRETIYKLQPRPVADRLLGVTEVQGEVKTRTVVVDQMGNVVNAGDTLTKTQIAHELGFVNAKGKADTKLVADLVNEAMQAGAIPMPWRDERTVIATGFDAELLPKLKAFYRANPIQRQQWIGEV